MTFSPNGWDLALASAVIAGNFLVDGLFLARLPNSSSIAMARRRSYIALLIFLWGCSGGVCALWLFQKRDWGLLLLGAPMSWRFALGLAAAGGCLLLIGLQHVSALRRARNQPGQGISLGSEVVDAMLPRSQSDYRLYALVAIAAGVCEELLFRGFLIALLANWFGLLGGAALSVILFGLCHAYQGRAGIVRTGAFGAVATALALGSGSLIPIIIIHAAADLSAGDLGFRLLGDGRAGPQKPSSA